MMIHLLQHFTVHQVIYTNIQIKFIIQMQTTHSLFILLVYVDNVCDECPCYAGFEEQLFNNAKYEMTGDDMNYNAYTGLIFFCI